MCAEAKYRLRVNPKVPLLVLIDEGYFGHEALHGELGEGFDVRFASGPLPLVTAMGELACPIVMAPRTLDPLPPI